MTDSPLPIDPTKPVAGNWRGTYAGFLAFSLTGYVANQGIFGKCVAFFCNEQFISCEKAEIALAWIFAGLVGFGINYAVTHWTQAKKLLALYEAYKALPETYPEYPKMKDNNPKAR